MVTTGYAYLAADVVKLTATAALLKMNEGPRDGEEVWAPLSIFEEPEFVDEGDDEVVLARWFVLKKGLA